MFRNEIRSTFDEIEKKLLLIIILNMIKSNFAELISILILELIELDEIEESIFIASTPVAS